MKDQDVNEAHRNSEGVYSKGCMLKRTVCILRDEEVGGLDMVTTDEDLVLRGD